MKKPFQFGKAFLLGESFSLLIILRYRRFFGRCNKRMNITVLIRILIAVKYLYLRPNLYPKQ